jgi:type II secretion system protein H
MFSHGTGLAFPTLDGGHRVRHWRIVMSGEMKPKRLQRSKAKSGFTLIEAMMVIAIIGILAAVAVPTLLGSTGDEQLKTSIRELSSAFSYARSEAIRTGEIHIVFVGTDSSGNALPNFNGNPAVVLVLNDGTPGSVNQNCQIDLAEPSWSVASRPAIAGGVLAGVVQMAEDVGTGTLATGSTFTEPDGDNASWVLFRPEGSAHAFDAGCAIGDIGTGAGGIYLNNGNKQFGFALRPLGNGRVRVWEEGNARWGN